MYCYGSSSGCLWSVNDCTTDSDCTKYNASNSQKFTGGKSYDCPILNPENDWIVDACECDDGKLILNIVSVKLLSL